MPTASEREIWREVERELGHAVPAAVRECCRVRDHLDTERRSMGRKESVRSVVEAVRRLERTVLQAAPPPAAQRRTTAVEVPDGARWQLLYDLGRHFERKYQGMPLTEKYHGFDPMTLEHYEDSSSYPRSRRIRVEFDSGMSLVTVFAILQREFRREYRPKGWVHTTRPLGDRGIALVRFVCTESGEGLSWRERLPLWNERFPQWRFKNVRAFQAAFRRAERQLTGTRGGLEVPHITSERVESKMHGWGELHPAPPRAKGTARTQALAAKEDS